MDKNLALSTSYDSAANLPLTFGPEWLNKEHSFPHAEPSHDEGGRHVSPKGRPPHLGKNRLPLKFTRSKSSPLLIQPPKLPEEILRDKAASSSPETNQPVNFEKNFPTLSTKAPPTKPATGSAWKQSPIEVITNPKSKEAAKINGQTVEEKAADDLEHLKGLVPSTAPPAPKVLRNNHSSKKPIPKSNSPAGPKPAIPKPPFNKSMFRKASSEPTLPLNPTYQEKYAKLIAQGNKSHSSASSSGSNTPERKDPGSDNEKNNNSRADFFLGLLKEEERKLKLQTDPNEKDSSDESKLKSPEKIELNTEDEERFLRDLGWVPEEEVHVPELTEQEILEVRAKILPHKERPTVTFNLRKKFINSMAVDPEFS